MGGAQERSQFQDCGFLYTSAQGAHIRTDQMVAFGDLQHAVLPVANVMGFLVLLLVGCMIYLFAQTLLKREVTSKVAEPLLPVESDSSAEAKKARRMTGRIWISMAEQDEEDNKEADDAEEPFELTDDAWLQVSAAV